MPVQRPVPSDRHAAISGRERTVIRGIDGELMEHHGHRRSRFRAQNYIRAIDLEIAGCCIRCKLAPDELRQGYPVPPTSAQEFVRRRHRTKASFERCYEIGDRSAPLAGMGDDGADRGECVFDTVVEFGQQSALLVLRLLALGYVNADSDDSVWVAFTAKGNETARLYPTQLATRTDDT